MNKLKNSLVKLLANSKIAFILVGASAAFVHQVVVIILVQANLSTPLIANIFAFICAWVVSYCGHYYASFKSEQSHLVAIPKFFLVSIIGFLINQSLYFILLNYTNLNYAVALFIVLLLVAIITYILGKFWAFSSK